MGIAHSSSRPLYLLSSDNENVNYISEYINKKSQFHKIEIHGVSELQSFDINLRAKLYVCLNNGKGFLF